MSYDGSDPALAYTLPFQLTKKIHRTVPDNLHPETPDLNASGKIVVITGGGSGIGAVSILYLYDLPNETDFDFSVRRSPACGSWPERRES